MATTEHDVLLSNIDKSGNVKLIYPVTKVGNVVGGADVDKYTTTLTASEFEALTTAELAALHESGVRQILVESSDGGEGEPLYLRVDVEMSLSDTQKENLFNSIGVVNNFTTTEAGYVADARTVAQLNSNIATKANAANTPFYTKVNVGSDGNLNSCKALNVLYYGTGASTPTNAPSSTAYNWNSWIFGNEYYGIQFYSSFNDDGLWARVFEINTFKDWHKIF